MPANFLALFPVKDGLRNSHGGDQGKVYLQKRRNEFAFEYENFKVPL